LPTRATVRVIFDQGFGPWWTSHYAKWHHFGDAAAHQIKDIERLNALDLHARGVSATSSQPPEKAMLRKSAHGHDGA